MIISSSTLREKALGRKAELKDICVQNKWKSCPCLRHNPRINCQFEHRISLVISYFKIHKSPSIGPTCLKLSPFCLTYAPTFNWNIIKSDKCLYCCLHALHVMWFCSKTFDLEPCNYTLCITSSQGIQFCTRCTHLYRMSALSLMPWRHFRKGK